MHFHLEIIMPPTDSVEASVDQIMKNFDENSDEDHQGFWDWFVIGGRFSGEKLRRACDQEKLAEFEAWMEKQEILVKSVVFGKREIASDEQRVLVDAKWSEMFPDFRGPCPIFKHAGQFLPLDVCKLSEVPVGLSAFRVIIADAEFSARHMVAQELWNGVTHQDTTWSGLVQDALLQANERLQTYREDYRAKNTPGDDWLVATVDYHS